ncbi:MAG TPA: hypothetical protein VFH53_10905 [Phycisphaerae bacterium]|nr:hypothetical protein [Phycisphaerae bacterium]
MKSRSKVLLLIWVACWVAAGLGPAGCAPTVPPEAKGCDVVRPALGFAIDVPKGWIVRDLGGDVVLEIVATDERRGETAVPAETPPEAPAAARRRIPSAVVQVTVIEREGETLDAWADDMTAELVSVQPDLAVSQRDEVELADGRPALLLTIENPRGVAPLEQRMLLAVTDEWAYALIATARQSEMAVVEPEIQVCFDSFVVW